MPSSADDPVPLVHVKPRRIEEITGQALPLCLGKRREVEQLLVLGHAPQHHPEPPGGLDERAGRRGCPVDKLRPDPGIVGGEPLVHPVGEPADSLLVGWTVDDPDRPLLDPPAVPFQRDPQVSLIGTFGDDRTVHLRPGGVRHPVEELRPAHPVSEACRASTRPPSRTWMLVVGGIVPALRVVVADLDARAAMDRDVVLAVTCARLVYQRRWSRYRRR
jgi:hypothetical protein